MTKILISACLIGQAVRYDATALKQDDELIKQWSEENRLIPICPEVSGGMSIPRAAAEIVGGNGNDVINGDAQVIDNLGNDVSHFFIKGAENALELCLTHNIKIAILTERSPSCGSQLIYNGEFNRTRVSGFGVTTALLNKNDIIVFNQHQLTEVKAHVY